jgi:GNAT superfamily N-acetyltransferase
VTAVAPAQSDLTVRPRRPDDLEALVGLLALTQPEAAYPADPAHVRADWIATDDELGAWVATRAGDPVAHVSLLAPYGLAAPLWREATGREDSGLAVISRLFSRAPGAGSALLSTAVQASHALDRTPVLETRRDSAAHRFYERRGWRTVGEVRQQWGSGAPTIAAVLVLT